MDDRPGARDVREPFLNARFRVEVEGLAPTGVLEVHLPWTRIVEERPRPPAVHYGPLVLRRGLTASGDWFRWWDGARRSPAAAHKRIVIVLMDRVERDAARWILSDARPVGYSLSPLNAMGSEVVVETLELSVGGFSASFARQPQKPRPASVAKRRPRTPRGRSRR